MRIRLILIGIIFCLTFLNINAKNKLENTIWMINYMDTSVNNQIYYIYLKNKYNIVIYDFPLEIGGIELGEYYYGFYNECELLSIDSLKDEGVYFFRVTDFYFKKSFWDEENKKFKSVLCLNYQIDKKEDGIYMYTEIVNHINYTGSLGKYKKLDKIPPKILEFLKKEEIEIPEELK